MRAQNTMRCNNLTQAFVPAMGAGQTGQNRWAVGWVERSETHQQSLRHQWIDGFRSGAMRLHSTHPTALRFLFLFCS
jgi:hypothetical protein